MDKWSDCVRSTRHSEIHQPMTSTPAIINVSIQIYSKICWCDRRTIQTMLRKIVRKTSGGRGQSSAFDVSGRKVFCH